MEVGDIGSHLHLRRLCTLLAELACIRHGREAHARIAKLGLSEGNAFLGSALVSMYSRFGALAEAKQAFAALTHRNVVAWTALMDAHTKNSMHGDEAIRCFRQMQDEGAISPDCVAFVSALKACILVEDVHIGREMHMATVKLGLNANPSFISGLIDMYAKCGNLVDAQNVFDKAPVEDVVTWTALIGGYAEGGYGHECLQLSRKLKDRGLSIDAVTYMYAVKACTCIGVIREGREMHAEAVKKGIETHSLACNASIDMYARFGLIQEAENVLEKRAPYLGTAAWNSIMAGFLKCGYHQEALDGFDRMQRCYGLMPDALTFSYALKAAKGTSLEACNAHVHAMHSTIMAQGLDDELLVGNSLVSIYASIELFAEAYGVLNRLSVRDQASWTALIAGFVEHGHNREATSCFEAMQEDGIFPDAVTFACMLKACSDSRNLDGGRKLYAEIVMEGLEGELPIIAHMLIDMYASCGALVDAHQVFEKLPLQATVACNVLLARYVEQGYHDEAIACLRRMQCDGILLDTISYLCILRACSAEGSIDKCREMHSEIALKGLEGEVAIGNTLVDSYGKCGLHAEARSLFEERLRIRDGVSWNAIIACYAQSGMIGCVLEMCERMIVGDVRPNGITFLGLLHACNHGGLIDTGELYYHVMRDEYRIIPSHEHYACLVDLFGRASRISTMKCVVEKVPMHPSLVMWHVVLRSCHTRGCPRLERAAAEHAAELDEQDSDSRVDSYNRSLDYEVLDLMF